MRNSRRLARQRKREQDKAIGSRFGITPLETLGPLLVLVPFFVFED